MSLCLECGKTLASPAGLRRHINSQHRRSEWHVCECGRQFLDPAGRSRCRARHAKSFGCPAYGCTYQSSRKDSVKQHMRRRHQDSRGLQVITLPANAQPHHHGHPHHHPHHHHHPHGHHHPPRSRQSSNSSLEFDPSPPPDLMPGTAATTNTTILPPPPLDATPYQAPLYYAEPSPESWPPPLLAQ